MLVKIKLGIKMKNGNEQCNSNRRKKKIKTEQHGTAMTNEMENNKIFETK